MHKHESLSAACAHLRKCGYTFNRSTDRWDHPAGGSAETWRGPVTGNWFIRRFDRGRSLSSKQAPTR